MLYGVIAAGQAWSWRRVVFGRRKRNRFDERTVSDDAGCTSWSGPYTVDGSMLVVDSLAMTDMACQPPIRMDQDTWLAQILSGRPTVELTGDTLRLTGSGVRITLLDREVAEP